MRTQRGDLVSQILDQRRKLFNLSMLLGGLGLLELGNITELLLYSCNGSGCLGQQARVLLQNLSLGLKCSERRRLSFHAGWVSLASSSVMTRLRCDPKAQQGEAKQI